MKFKVFEEIKVWKDSRELVKMVYTLANNSAIKKDFGFKDQITRAAVSIMNNIAEGHERNSPKEFIKFLSYSKGSAGEVRSMLYTACDLNYITKEQFKSVYQQSIEIIKSIIQIYPIS
jgi:four helix bundle protein